jgi:hypothetical protein
MSLYQIARLSHPLEFCFRRQGRRKPAGLRRVKRSFMRAGRQEGWEPWPSLPFLPKADPALGSIGLPEAGFFYHRLSPPAFMPPVGNSRAARCRGSPILTLRHRALSNRPGSNSRASSAAHRNPARPGQPGHPCDVVAFPVRSGRGIRQAALSFSAKATPAHFVPLPTPPTC